MAAAGSPRRTEAWAAFPRWSRAGPRRCRSEHRPYRVKNCLAVPPSSGGPTSPPSLAWSLVGGEDQGLASRSVGESGRRWSDGARVDGDGTYPASHVGQLLAPVLEDRADVVVGNRLLTYEKGAYRPFHVSGNRLLVSCDQHHLRSEADRRDVRLSELQPRRRAAGAGGVEGLRGRDGDDPAGTLPWPSHSGGAGAVRQATGRLLLEALDLARRSTGGREDRRHLEGLSLATALLAPALEIMALVSVSCGVTLDSVNHHFREVSQLILALVAQPYDGRSKLPVGRGRSGCSVALEQTLLLPGLRSRGVDAVDVIGPQFRQERHPFR